MEITKSIQRIAWRFSQGKAFLPNENDTDALNGIIAFYNQQQEQISFSQEPFAKMYLYLYREMILKKQFEDVNIPLRKALVDALSVPIDFHIGNIKSEMETVRIGNVAAKENVKTEDILAAHIDQSKLSKFFINQINQILTEYEQTQ